MQLVPMGLFSWSCSGLHTGPGFLSSARAAQCSVLRQKEWGAEGWQGWEWEPGDPMVGLMHFWMHQVSSVGLQFLQGERDDQEGLSKPRALVVALHTTETTDFSGNELAHKFQKLLQIQVGALSAGRTGVAISHRVRAGNNEIS